MAGDGRGMQEGRFAFSRSWFARLAEFRLWGLLAPVIASSRLRTFVDLIEKSPGPACHTERRGFELRRSLIRREEQLVVYERLGDIRSRPVCIGRRQQWPPAAIQLVANWLLPSADESITS